MLENNDTSTCQFAVAMVSYIYDEIEGADRTRFEHHLTECIQCADELTAFVNARTSIRDWHNEEFVPLATPEISIPYQKESKLIDGQVPPSWIESISRIFTLSPAWATGAAGFATLAICVGMFFAMYGSLPETDEVRVQLPKGSQVRVSPRPTGDIENTNSNISDPPQSGEGRERSANDISTGIDPTARTTTGSGPSSTRSKNVAVKRNIQPVPSGTNRTPPKQNSKKAPRLVDDEDEDNSLRLSDLLEEIGMLK